MVQSNNNFTMKQPELGRKIYEWRKAKGMTQEELVERCNLSVRTIQRIEAGEVSPRSYTIKAILEALEIKEKIQLDQTETRGRVPWWIYSGLAGGCIYLLASTVELSYEYEWAYGSGTSDFKSLGVVGIKVLSYVAYLVFLLGWYGMLRFHPNQLLKISIWIMMGVSFVFLGLEVIALMTEYLEFWDVYPVKVIAFGLGYTLVGMGFIAYQKKWSGMGLVIGALTVVSGVLILSGVGALLGLIILTVAEIGQIGLLVYLVSKIGGRNSPGSPQDFSEF